MSEKNSEILQECLKLIEEGYDRDQIDTVLQQKGLDAKAIAAVQYELQDIFVDIELIKQKTSLSNAYFVATIICLLITIFFTVIYFIKSGYSKIAVSLIMLFITYSFYKKGRNIKSEIQDAGKKSIQLRKRKR